MQVDINWIAVVLAALSSMVVGSIWYSPKVFGNIWIKLAKVKVSGNGKDAIRPILITLVVSFLTAFVVAHVTYLTQAFYQNSFLHAALSTGFWLWLGLTAARFITHDQFEGRPARLTVLNIAHELATIMLMALIIGLMAPDTAYTPI